MGAINIDPALASERDRSSFARVIDVVAAATPEEIDAVRFLFLAHATALRLHRGSELIRADAAGLPGSYVAPRGRLYLARLDDAPTGCYRADERVDRVFFECDLTARR